MDDGDKTWATGVYESHTHVGDRELKDFYGLGSPTEYKHNPLKTAKEKLLL